MISDGIENCLQYIDNFNPEKSQNPFAYFTQIIYYAFLRRIQKEKKQMYTKYKLMGEMEVMNLTSDSQRHDSNYVPQGKMSEWSKDHVGTFIENFEESKRRKKNKNTTAVDVLIGDE
jgi:exonuclease III